VVDLLGEISSNSFQVVVHGIHDIRETGLQVLKLGSFLEVLICPYILISCKNSRYTH